MAIKTEISEDGIFVKTYSDEGRYVVREDNGVSYEWGYDPVSLNRVYTEGEVIPPPEPVVMSDPIEMPPPEKASQEKMQEQLDEQAGAIMELAAMIGEYYS